MSLAHGPCLYCRRLLCSLWLFYYLYRLLRRTRFCFLVLSWWLAFLGRWQGLGRSLAGVRLKSELLSRRISGRFWSAETVRVSEHVGRLFFDVRGELSLIRQARQCLDLQASALVELFVVLVSVHVDLGLSLSLAFTLRTFLRPRASIRDAVTHLLIPERTASTNSGLIRLLQLLPHHPGPNGVAVLHLLVLLLFREELLPVFQVVGVNEQVRLLART